MAFADLTSPHAVGQALDEFDRLGRREFLAKYGFGPAREYFIRRENCLYDSKAVVGAAHGFQFPQHGPLRPSDFSGGEATVQRKLEELGYEVAVVRMAPPIESPLGDSKLPDLERAFHTRMIEIYNSAKAIGYNATRFLGMVSEHGGVETARILLRASNVSEGYTALWERGHLDLTVEAVVLQPDWLPLFSDAERRVAIKRLRDYEYPGPLPEL